MRAELLAARGDLRLERFDAVDVDQLLFEAPRKEQQVWFLKRFGREVNLGNIPPGEVLPLETLRLGLRSDTAFAEPVGPGEEDFRDRPPRRDRPT